MKAQRYGIGGGGEEPHPGASRNYELRIDVLARNVLNGKGEEGRVLVSISGMRHAIQWKKVHSPTPSPAPPIQRTNAKP